MGMKTNAARLLASLGIRYELREYDYDPGALDAESVARKIGLPPEQVFKTLVARGDREGVCLAVVPANTELNEKPSPPAPATAGSSLCRSKRSSRSPVTFAAVSPRSLARSPTRFSWTRR